MRHKYELLIEPSPKRVRALVDEMVVVDSLDTRLLLEVGSCRSTTSRHPMYAWKCWNLAATSTWLAKAKPGTGRSAQGNAISIMLPGALRSRLRRSPCCATMSRSTGIDWTVGTRKTSNSSGTRATRYYLPRADVRMELLQSSPTTTFCAYKGKAYYWSAWVDGRLYPDIAWSYPEPLPEQPRLRDRICFYNERVDEIRVEGISSSEL